MVWVGGADTWVVLRVPLLISTSMWWCLAPTFFDVVVVVLADL